MLEKAGTMLLRALLTVLLIAVSPAWAQDPVSQPPPPPASEAEPVPDALATPAATISSFVDAMVSETPDFDAAFACLDLSDVSDDAARPLATKLYGVIIRVEDVEIGDWQNRGLLRWPRESENTAVLFPRPDAVGWRQWRLREIAGDRTLTLSRHASGKWVFSKETLADVGELYDAMEGEPIVGAARAETTLSSALWLRSQFPPWALKTALGLEYWQWFGLLVLAFAGVLLDFTVRFLVSVLSRRIIHHRGGEANQSTLRRTVRPFGLAAMALVWLWGVRFLDLPPMTLAVLMPAMRFFAMLAAVWALYRVTDLVGEVASQKASDTDTKFDDLLIPLVRKSVKVFITIFGLIYIADSMHVPIAPLLTGLGIGGAGFAFAAKDTLEHFFGSVTVIADRPFQVGDWVSIGDVEGTVEEVGFRSTRVRTFYNSLVSIPNGNLVRAVVDNFGLRKYRRWKTHLNLTYDTAPDVIEAFCEGLRELIRLHPYTRKDYYQVWLHAFSAHSLDVLVYLFFEAPDWQTELRERHRIMTDILRLADRLGVQFAFPTQTLHVQQEAPDAIREPKPAPDSATDRRARRKGREAVRAVTAESDWRRRLPGPYVIRGAPMADEDEETQIESRIGGDA